MAGRSFKPGIPSSLLQSPKLTPQSSRPSFTRTSSSSSTLSTKSDDSFAAVFNSNNNNIKRETTRQGLDDDSGVGHILIPGTTTTTTTTAAAAHTLDDTPGRNRSDPLPIPARGRNNIERVYTPLSARGDFPTGGYFPDHSTYTPQQYTGSRTQHERTLPPSPLHAPSNNPSSMSSENTPRALRTPDLMTMAMPMGKYHPSHYQFNHPTTYKTPPPPSLPTSTPSMSLSLTPRRNQNQNKRPEDGVNRSSDVKRQIQQYQRDMMITNSRRMATSSTLRGSKPESPKLEPLGSPGPITPFELEEAAGYLVAGNRSHGVALDGKMALSEREIVGNMIQAEERRARASRTPSPTLRS